MRIRVTWRDAVSLVLVVAVSFMAAGSSRAQTPPKIEVGFTPSADHDAKSNGVDIVTRYDLRASNFADTVVLGTSDLGKPTPGTTGCVVGEATCIWVDRTTFLRGLPAPGGANYKLRVVAIGPGGEAASAPLAWAPPTPPTPTAPASAPRTRTVP